VTSILSVLDVVEDDVKKNVIDLIIDQSNVVLAFGIIPQWVFKNRDVQSQLLRGIHIGIKKMKLGAFGFASDNDHHWNSSGCCGILCQ